MTPPPVFAAIVAGLLMLSAAAAAAADLVVEVTGVRSGDGLVRIAVYGNERDFLKKEVTRRIVPAVAGVTSVSFPDLPPGAYAIAAYHDENGNGRFDKLLGALPAEGYGFSNDVRPFLSPPPFAGAAFDLATTTGTTTIRFKLVYP